MPEQPGQVDSTDETTVVEQVESTDAAAPADDESTDAEAPAEVEPESADEDSEAVEVEVPEVPARVIVADEVLLASVDLARRSLLEVTPAETVGSVIGHVAEDDHVLTLLFAADLGGYPGWRWSVTIARVDDGEPTVLETELMPGDTALLAPEWVPWSERLADYRAAQEASAAAAAAAAGESEREGAVDEGEDAEEVDDELGADDEDLDEDDDEDLDEDDDEDLDDEDDADLDDEAELDAAFGHDDGDDEFDGIDIDALDDSAGEDEDDSDDEDSDDSDEDDSDDEDSDDSDEDDEDDADEDDSDEDDSDDEDDEDDAADQSAEPTS